MTPMMDNDDRAPTSEKQHRHACESCNQSKATKTADEYFAWLKGRDGQ